MYQLDVENAADWWEVEALFDLCFAPGREMLPSYRLRHGIKPIKALCLLARDGNAVLAGAIRYWPVCVGGAPVLLLGPVAVHPTRQGEGLAGVLIEESLTRARDRGWHRVMLIGDVSYYNRFGFARLEGLEMPPPTNPDRVLGRGLSQNAWRDVSGAVTPLQD